MGTILIFVFVEFLLENSFSTNFVKNLWKYTIEYWRLMMLEIILNYVYECLGERSPGVPYLLNCRCPLCVEA
jgi:hypothetical protein